MDKFISFIIFVIVANIIQTAIKNKRKDHAAKKQQDEKKPIMDENDDPFKDYGDPWAEFDKKEGKK